MPCDPYQWLHCHLQCFEGFQWFCLWFLKVFRFQHCLLWCRDMILSVQWYWNGHHCSKVQESQLVVSEIMLILDILDICSIMYQLISISYQSINPSIHPFVCLSINPTIYQSVHPSIHPSVGQSVPPSIHLTICLSIQPFIPLSICLPICLSKRHPFFCPSIHPSICPPIHPSIP